VDPASPSQNSSIYDAPSPSSADEDDLPATPPSSVLEYAVLGFDGKVIKQETPTYPSMHSSTLTPLLHANHCKAFPVAVAASSPFSFAPASPVYSHVSQTSTSIYSAAKSTSSASLPVSFASLLPVSPAYSPLPSPVSFAPVYSVANSIAAVPFFDAEEAEITDATAGFYGGFDVEESPSPYHAPLIDEDAGFGDIRDGCERFPEQWTDSDTQAKLVAPYKLTGLQTFSEDLELPADKSVKSILKPVSQIAKAAKTCDMGFGYIHRATFVPQLTALSGFSDEVIAKLNGKQLQFHLPVAADSRTGTKRTAPDSIATNENWDGMSPLPTTTRLPLTLLDSTYDGDEEDDFEEPQFVKKVRLSDDNTMDVDVIYAPMPSTLTVPNLKHKTSTRSITQSLLHEHVDFSPVIDGYPGQFKALLPPSKIFHRKSLPPFHTSTTLITSPAKAMCGGVPKKVTFGDEGHANGLFHHTRFQGGGNTPYSKYSLDFNIMGPTGDDKLLKTIQIADKNHYIAADTKRTVEQDALRRETHFECSFARLENVTVGEYRYYHGNSSIEDYNEGGLCVCWKECFCSDMCSKYADMLCLCAKYLEFEV
jgi:hypothetical protein